jgi:two-component system sensor histidine kinase DesK
VTQRTETGDQFPFGSDRSRAGWLFAAIWLIYLGEPLGVLFGHGHSAAAIAATLVAVAVFSATYVGVNLIVRQEIGRAAAGPPRRPAQARADRRARGDRGGAAADRERRVGGAVDLRLQRLRGRAADARAPAWAMRGGLVASLAMVVEAVALGVDVSLWLSLLLPCVFSFLGVMAVRGMRDLIRQLHQARAEVARLAAAEERLRMARDLHDLAGHSLATITLKAELARKLLRVDLDRSEQQILDLEHVSREALADIREAVSGYRRATLAVEAASARTALEAAGIALDLDPSLANRSGTLDPDAESALAWCLREAVTNVVRHSGARHCRVRLIDARVDGEPSLTLEVLDDGPAGPATAARRPATASAACASGCSRSPRRPC